MKAALRLTEPWRFGPNGLAALLRCMYSLESMAAQAGVDLPPGAIAALFAAIDVSAQGPFEAVARLGLSIAQVSEY